MLEVFCLYENLWKDCSCANIKKVKYEHEFVDWINNKSRVIIQSDQNFINICRECMKNYDERNQNQNKVNESNESIKTVDLTIKDLLDCLSEANSLELPDLSEVIAIVVESEIGNAKKPESKTSNTKDSQNSELSVKEPNTIFITLVCYNRFEKPHRKLDGALAILYDLDNIKNFGNIEEEILSRTLHEKWRKIELGRLSVIHKDLGLDS
ncbi:hypothetical protein C2G38_2223521 [Gigaspora rosea]|uniref:Uncharacterized protein n=1 Tax=Gigaspora rosea TaxID=44941 RepID=A0A397U1C5_9GLOM|nr:hypothetical protein C2G38_2223521 [Gigaspora rosea]